MARSSHLIETVLPSVLETMEHHPCTILSAEPGAGKTTLVPLALAKAHWLDGRRIVMLEPRRLAARRAAEYMASLLAENVGETVGFRIRGESRIGKNTRIEVVTEGILTRFLQNDPGLPNIGVLIFDEFHERSIHADLGLALALDVQKHLRPDLRILIMSATLDGVAVAKLLNNAPVVQCGGRTFPVITRYLSRPNDRPIERAVAATAATALREAPGDILVFLPGQREIRRVEALLTEADLDGDPDVRMLFGDAPPETQRAALRPGGRGKRKIILSTNIAETSLTIEGVGVVIDSGLARAARFDPRRGMSGLETIHISQASADQRRGRAGRQQPGICYRLWTEAEQTTRTRFSTPEILSTDLAPLALELACWGDPEGEHLQFLDNPPAPHLLQARSLLQQLGALDSGGKLTSHGRVVASLPVHPRLAHMMIRGKEMGLGSLACDVAALIEERDLLRGARDTDVDLFSRWDELRNGKRSFERERALAQAARLRSLVDVRNDLSSGEKLGVLLGLAYPGRIARRQEEKYLLSGGARARLQAGSLLQRNEFLAVGDVDGTGAEVKILLAAPISETEVRNAFADRIEIVDDIRWDSFKNSVSATRKEMLGAIELSAVPLQGESEQIRSAMIEGIREMGLSSLPWTKETASLKSRCEWLRSRRLVADGWPDLGDKALLESLDRWLGPFLDGITKKQQLAKLDLSRILRLSFTHLQLSELNRLAPTHLTVPTGSRIALDYGGDFPVLAVRLQEIFGQTTTPTVADEKIPVLIHLLSPAHRPLAITQDLPSFWRNVYPDVRKDMRGRYPKHHWPENPLEATPTKRTTRK